MFNKNRRQFSRLTVHHLIKYKILDNKESLTFARNLSAGGVLFYCKEKLSRGATVELTINFPDWDRPLEVHSEIVWVKVLKKTGGYDVGARFLNLDKDAQQKINDKIQHTFRIAKEGESPNE